MSATAVVASAPAAPPSSGPPPPRRSFLASVRRILWNAGHRTSGGTKDPPSASAGDSNGRKRPRGVAEGEQRSGGGGEELGIGGPDRKTGTNPNPSNAGSSAATVILVSSDEEEEASGEERCAAVATEGRDAGDPPPAKRARTASGAVATAAGSVVGPRVVDDFPSMSEEDPDNISSSKQSLLLTALPPEVLSADVLSFVSTSRDRRSLQLTCRTLRDATNRPAFLGCLDVGGAGVEGRRGLILEGDGPRDAVRKLLPFSRAGNMQAIYMLGMIKAYCFDSPKHGIALLRLCADDGYVRAAYALGLILRDSSRDESRRWLARAAEANFIPAYQELLPAQEVKARYGDLDAARLRAFLDFPCLNRLLGRHYVDSNPRCVQTSHCWNPLCGRWAYKATPSVDQYLRRREQRAARRRADASAAATAAMAASAAAGGDVARCLVINESHNDPLTNDDPSVMSVLRDVGERGVGVGGGGGGTVSVGAGGTVSVRLRAAATSQVVPRRPPGAGASPGRYRMTFGAGLQPLPDHGAAAANNDDRGDNDGQDGNGNGNEGDNGGADGGDGGSGNSNWILRVSRMKMCSSCRRAKYCSKLCQVYDWRSGRHKTECQYLG